MKRKVLLSSAIALTVLGTSLFSQFKTFAEPNPLFQSVINEIRASLPQGLKMRLPSVLPAAADKIELSRCFSARNDKNGGFYGQ